MRLALAIMLAGLLLAACDSKGPSFEATDITGAQLGGELRLTDHNGTPRSLADFRGKVLVVFFGFTHCPDVCPTTLLDWSNVLDRLTGDQQSFRVLFVSVDGRRDTPEALQGYMRSFNRNIIALTGSEPEIAAAALANYLLKQPHGGETIRTMIIDDIHKALEAGRVGHAQELFMALRHFLDQHPEARAGVES